MGEELHMAADSSCQMEWSVSRVQMRAELTFGLSLPCRYMSQLYVLAEGDCLSRQLVDCVELVCLVLLQLLLVCDKAPVN
jgi:hypothetical protein